MSIGPDLAGMLRRCWQWLVRPSARFSVLALAGSGVVAGVLLVAAGYKANEYSLTTEFCISCHEMRDISYAEYKESIHYSNRSGIRVSCADCHEPHEFGPMIVRKLQASTEVWGSWTGVINTPEKFEARRMHMAEWEWARQKASGSRECRNCHNFDAMSPAKQKQSNYKRHVKAKDAGKTCIDCHKGIAHKLPKEYEEPDDEE